VLEEVDLSFAAHFGRQYGGAVEDYRCEDADHILVTTGSVTGTARCVVDRMRLEGHRVGLLKLRLVRPFPSARVAEVVKNAKTIGVLDKNISFGYEGTIYTNMNSALQKYRLTPLTLNFIAGLGGRDVTQTDIEIAYTALETMKPEENGTVKYCNVRCEL